MNSSHRPGKTTAEQIEELTKELGYTWRWSPLKLYIFSGPMPGARTLKTFPCVGYDFDDMLNRALTWLERKAK